MKTIPVNAQQDSTSVQPGHQAAPSLSPITPLNSTPSNVARPPEEALVEPSAEALEDLPTSNAPDQQGNGSPPLPSMSQIMLLLHDTVKGVKDTLLDHGKKLDVLIRDAIKGHLQYETNAPLLTESQTISHMMKSR